MKQRTLWPVVVVILILLIIAVAGYFMSKNASPVQPGQTSTATTTSSDPASSESPTTSDEITSALVAAIPFPTATSTPGPDWKPFANKAAGYSLQYPNDLLQSIDGNGALTLVFPKNNYFHWPLLDDVTVKITSGLSCPAAITEREASTTFSFAGINWIRTVGDGVGAGNRYREVDYDTTSNGTCYHIGFLDHGTNGAGFYVDDQSLIKKYDAIHDADFAHVVDVFNAMVASFRILPHQSRSGTI